MKIFDVKPIKFRIFLVLISVLMLTAIGINFYRVAGTVLAGLNLEELPGVFYFTENIYVESDDKDLLDTIKAGNYLIEANNREVKSKEQFILLIDTTQIINVKVFDYSTKRTNAYKVNVNQLSNSSIDSIEAGILISAIESGSAAERAGIKAGDVLISINDVQIGADNRALKYLRQQRSGNILTYRILREAKIIDYDLELANYGVKFTFICNVIIGLAFFLTGFFIGIKRPNIKASRITTVMLCIFGYVIAVGMTLDPMNLDYFSYLRFFTHSVGLLFVPPLVFHSLHYFPEEKLRLLKNKLPIAIPYILATTVVLAAIVLWVIGYQFNLFYVYVIGFSCFLAYFLIYHFKNRGSVRSEKSKMHNILVFVYSFNLAGLIINTILKYFMIKSDSLLLDIFLEYGFLLMILIPAAYIYTIAKFRLLDLEIRIRKNIQYTFVSFIWHILLIAVFVLTIWNLSTIEWDLPNIRFSGTGVEVLERPLSKELYDIYSKLIVVLFSIAITVIYFKIFKNSRNLLDKMFYRVHFDYKKTSSELSAVMENSLNINDLSEQITCKLRDSLGLKQIGIVLFNKEGQIASQFYSGLNDKQLREYTEAAGKSLYDSTIKFAGIIRIEYLPELVKSVLIECKFYHIFPIKSKGKLFGLLLLGEKLSETHLRSEDTDMLSSISSQASVAIENAFLYQDLAKQERMKHELEIARKIQLASLPKSVPVVQGIQLAGMSLPALEVGGDFYDFLNHKDNELTIIVGDVSGKGTSAALYMSKVQGVLRTLHEFYSNPFKLLVKANDLLYKYLDRSWFISASGAGINGINKTLKFARAGHLPLFHYSAERDRIAKIIPKGLVMGLTDGEIFERNLEEIVISYKSGDIFLFITDGITEARNIFNEEYGYDRITELLYKLKNSSANELVEGIIQDVQQFSLNKEQFDDITIVAVRID